jgi:O-antigen ligase
MISITNLEDDYNTTAETGRKAVWRRGRGYIREKPLLGVGLGNFPIAEGQALEAANSRGKWSAAHNAYVQAFAELGLPGGTLLILIIVSGSVVGVRFARGVRFGDEIVTRPEYIASVASYSVSAIFLSHAYFSPYFALVGLIALADRAAQFGATAASPHVGVTEVSAPIRAAGERGGLAWRPAWPAN